MENSENKSLFKLIKSNEIAAKTAKCFLQLGVVAGMVAVNAKLGLNLIENPDQHSSLPVALLGFNGLAIIAASYFTAMNFAHLGKMLKEEEDAPKITRFRMH
jgi:hypothetical protein